MSEELKGCPFCSAPDPSFGYSFAGLWFGEVECADCGAKVFSPAGVAYASGKQAQDAAIAAWNRRPDPAPSGEELREQIARIINGLPQANDKVLPMPSTPDSLTKADQILALRPDFDAGREAGLEEAARIVLKRTPVGPHAKHYVHVLVHEIAAAIRNLKARGERS